MKLAIQQTLVPGASLNEKFEKAAAYGFDGVELAAWGFSAPAYEFEDEIREAVAESGLPVSSFCTMGGDDFVHPDPAERAKRLDGLVRMLQLADAVGARGVVALPIRPPVHLPDLSPVADERTLITQVAVEMLKAAIDRTQGCEARIFLEPLNRYEAYYLRTVADAVALSEAVEAPRVQAMGDVFHMNIEEADMGAALRAAGGRLGHIHLADSNRIQPGKGHLDFGGVFRALLEIAYDGWMSMECGIEGDPQTALPETVAFLRDQIAVANS